MQLEQGIFGKKLFKNVLEDFNAWDLDELIYTPLCPEQDFSVKRHVQTFTMQVHLGYMIYCMILYFLVN